MNTIRIIHTHICNILLSASLCASSVMAMEDKSPIEKTAPNVFDLMTNHLSQQEIGRLKQTSKTMKKNVENIGTRAFDVYTQNKDSQTPIDKEKAENAINKAGRFGNTEAREILEQGLIQKMNNSKHKDDLFNIYQQRIKKDLIVGLGESDQIWLINSLYKCIGYNDKKKNMVMNEIFTFCGNISFLAEGGQKKLITVLTECVTGHSSILSMEAMKEIISICKNISSLTEGGKQELINCLMHICDSPTTSEVKCMGYDGLDIVGKFGIFVLANLCKIL